jgi:DNA helicase IV
VVRGLQRHLERRRDVLVVNWQAPVAAPYFEASHEAPLNVRFRRSFQCNGNKILSFDDVVFLELAAEVASLLGEPEMDDALLSELAPAKYKTSSRRSRPRSTRSLERSSTNFWTFRGGAGTGKTAVGLHRVSWLLYNHRDRLDPRDVVEKALQLLFL